ncbi:Carbon monoxide dehydrogenase subunit G [Nostocoides australiense Ben110]|uniref:Carbon monoxide dehydrogenase subunit G n=1 Tax=Nostocoides australiense Ben110 TaxID=1193182 RepID=W6JVW2_9MICO|nr:SRPBCC family protein [Tetrasphaera australiensis]CCH73658.1 Carbon monoxide dehydrogenase subunit G [Tetrasphaera australiensis Ben110]
MELTHDFVVPASLDAAWATFMDLEQVGSCFPGATVESVTDEGFTGTVKVKLGPIALVYTGAGKFIERDDAAHRAVIEAKGKDKRGNGTAGATVTVHLAPADGGEHTRVDVTTDLAITGKPAQFGRGVMQDVSDKLLQQFVTCIEGRFAPAPTPAAVFGDTTPEDVAVAVTPDNRAEPSAETTPTPAPTTGPATGPVARPGAQDDAIDLGATVLPVLARAYAPHIATGLVGLYIGWKLGRRLPG